MAWRADSATCAAVIPNASKSFGAGAEAPKLDIPTKRSDFLSHSCHDCATPASIGNARLVAENVVLVILGLCAEEFE